MAEVSYDGFGSRAWTERLKKAKAFRLVSSASDERPPVPVDPYGTNPGAWADVLRTAIVEGPPLAGLERAIRNYQTYIDGLEPGERTRYHTEVMADLHREGTDGDD